MREFNENILESLDDGLVVFDVDERIVRWNRALERFYGVTQPEAIGRTLAEIFDRPFVDALRAARRDHPEGATLYRVALAARKAEAPRLLVNATAVPLRAPSGGSAVVVGTILLVEDVTERVRLEEQLQISDKMASIGLLAAGVAHEVNTPLTGISSFTQMLLEGADPRRSEDGAAREDRAADVPRREDRQRPAQPVAARHAGRRAHPRRSERRRRRRLLAARASVRGDEDQGAPRAVRVAGDGARDRASAPAGVPEPVPQRARCDAARRLAVGGDPRRGRSGDRPRSRTPGSGIPAEHLARIYDPFFTTKAIGRGTGLGLSITYGIVHEHDGTIRCDSAVGQGTRFTMSLPLAGAGASGRSAAVRPARNQHARPPGITQHGHFPKRHDSRHRRRRDHARDSRDAAHSRRLRGPARLVGRGRARHRARAAVRRRDRRHHDAGPRRHRHARRAEAHRRGPGGRHDHRLRVGRERHLRR